MSNQIQIHKITQGVSYINGVTTLGQVESVQMDDLKFIFDDFKALGMVGKLKLPTTGVEEGKGKIKFNSLYPNAAKTLTPFSYNQLQIRSSVQKHENRGKIGEVPLVTILTIAVQNTPMGKFEQHKSIEFEYDFTYSYIKQVLDGEELLEYDAFANVLKFGGVDLLEQYRSNVM